MNVKHIENFLIGLYQEIYLNDLAVMRGAIPLFQGTKSPNGIIYLSDFPSLVDTSSPRRALDIATLVYSILNGLRRMLGNKLCKSRNTQHCKCVYNLERLDRWNKECNALKLVKAAAKILNINIQSLEKKNPLKEFVIIISELIKYLINNGYIIPIPYNAVNLSPYPLKFINLEYIKGKYYEIKPSSIEELASIKTAMVLNKFFRDVCSSFYQNCEPYQLLNKIKKIIEREIYGDMPDKNAAEYNIMFKTYHGELLRSVYNSKPLPPNIINFEGRILPFIFEIPPLSVIQHDINKLSDLIKKCFIHSGIPDDKSQILTDVLLQSFIAAGYHFLNNYQYKYLRKIFQNYLDNKYPIRALLASPTGTGKTLIFIMYALFLSLLGKAKKQNVEYKTVIIYPRKALATDQLLKIIKVIYILNEKLNNSNDQQLKKINISIGIRDGDSPSYGDLKGKDFIPLRNLEISTTEGNVKIFHKVDETSRKYCIKLEEKEICEEDKIMIRDYKNPEIFNSDIIVTNHSQLNKLLSEVVLGKNSNSVLDFLSKLKLLIIDEAHIFLERKNMYILQSALLKLYYYKGSNDESKRIMNGINKLDIILSSATITNSSLTEIELDGQKATIPSRNIIGIFRLSKETTQNIDEIKNLFNKIILEPPVRKPYELIYIDYYSTLSETKNVTENYNGIYKIRSSALIVPYPHRSSWTSLNESLIALTHWINAQRRKNRTTTAMVFVDSKSTLKEIFRIYNERQIVEAKDHIDRVLLSALDKDINQRKKAYDTIVKVILGRSGNDLYSAIWDLVSNKSEYFSLFHCLSHYLDLEAIRHIRKLKIPNNISSLIKRFNESSLLRGIYDDMDKITNYSNFILKNNIFENLEKETRGKSQNRNRNTIDRTIEILKKDYIEKSRTPPYYILHHGSLSRKARNYFEDLLKKSGKLKSIVPYIIFSTSTLEVGVDIPHVSVVLQYGSEPLPQEIQQRFGRSGRSPHSMFISLGILVLRNRGEDLAYITDEAATEYVYSLRIPHISSIIDDPIEIMRQLSGILFETSSDIFTDQQKMNKNIKRIKLFTKSILKDINEVFGNHFEKLNIEFLEKLISEWINRVKKFNTRDELPRESNSIELGIQNFTLLSALEDALEEISIDKNSHIAKYVQRLLRIVELIKASIDSINGKKIDNVLEIYSYISHLVNYDLFEINYYIYKYYFLTNDNKIGQLMKLCNNFLDIVTNILNNISLYLQDLLKYYGLYTDIDIAKVLMRIYPPGYANPVTYSENIYKLLEFSTHHDHPEVKEEEFFTLISRSRPLHTG